jgi:ATP-dependent Clp protease ATP-binding subunit ClpB
VADRLSSRKIRLEVTEDAVEFLASRGYDPAFGARPVKRVVQQLLETSIAKVRI